MTKRTAKRWATKLEEMDFKGVEVRPSKDTFAPADDFIVVVQPSRGDTAWYDRSESLRFDLQEARLLP